MNEETWVINASPLGSLGVILRARKAGLIPAARPLIEQLIASGSYLSAELIRQALIRVGE